MIDNKIDIVVTWVDGNDVEWQEEKEKYSPNRKKDNSATNNRFRDWGLMKYWFRGVEKYAPWVNHVYFVTCGHVPEWLNLDNPKLTHVKHSDYIPQELLPTFNSNTIEMYLNRIEGLSEQFVIFNDDSFIISETRPEDFFVDGRPCETALLGALSSFDINDVFPHILLNNSAIINKHFNKNVVISKNKRKFINYKYGLDAIRTVALLPFVYFSDFRDLHLPSSHLKSVFEEVWTVEYQSLYNGSKSRFRSILDVNQWLMKDWYMCKGEFEPRSSRWGKKFELGVDHGECDYIKKHKGKVICINDSIENLDFDDYKKRLTEAFEEILPNRSSFEK